MLLVLLAVLSTSVMIKSAMLAREVCAGNADEGAEGSFKMQMKMRKLEQRRKELEWAREHDLEIRITG